MKIIFLNTIYHYSNVFRSILTIFSELLNMYLIIRLCFYICFIMFSNP